MSDRMICWFSCGAASAVAAKLALTHYADDFDVIEVVYTDMSADEHPDNQRFLADCEKWLGVTIRKIRHPKYVSIAEVFRGERFLVSHYGAPCTRLLKKYVGKAYRNPGDVEVYGFTSEESHRADRFRTAQPDIEAVFPLIEQGLTKADCLLALDGAGIELPAMYRLGYANNNCIGCVKGGAGYWNRIRIDFPERFAAMAALEREIGATILRDRRTDARLYLDELDPSAGRFEPPPACGLFCEQRADEIAAALASPAGEAEA